MSVSVSETIGKLLLEGYKMLADSCDVCCTVLMQDRRGRVICVNCESTSMANAAQHPEMDITRPSVKISNGGSNITNNSNRNENTVTSLDLLNGSSNVANRGNSGALASCEDILAKEIQNATITLQNLSQQQHDLQGKLMYIRYIRECAETIQALKGLKKA